MFRPTFFHHPSAPADEVFLLRDGNGNFLQHQEGVSFDGSRCLDAHPTEQGGRSICSLNCDATCGSPHVVHIWVRYSSAWEESSLDCTSSTMRSFDIVPGLLLLSPLQLVAAEGLANLISAATLFTGPAAPIIDLGYAKYQGKQDSLTKTSNYLGLKYANAPYGNSIVA